MKKSFEQACSLATAFALAAALTVGAVPSAFAAPTMVLTPTKVRSMVVNNNFGVQLEFNNLHQAKDNVDIARGNLLPSFNIGAIISGLLSGPAFALQGISMLLPFLLPTNWANLHQAEDQLEAEKIGYRLVELNNYASAYALYETVIGDMAVRETLVAQYNDLVWIRDWLIQQKPLKNFITQGDIDYADSQVNVARANIATLDTTLLTERSNLEFALGLPNDNFTLSTVHTPMSSAETIALNLFIKQAQKAAPENSQLVFLAKAAEQNHFGKEWSWLGTPSLSLGGGGSSFGNLSMSGAFTFSFAMFPTMTLARDQIVNVQIQEKQMLAQELQLAQQTQGSISQAKLILTAQTNAAQELVAETQEQFVKYSLGKIDLQLVFTAEAQAEAAKAQMLKAQQSLDQFRVTLHRELLTDQFAGIPGCRIRPEAEEKDKQFNFGRLFNPSSFQLTIDQACAPAN